MPYINLNDLMYNQSEESLRKVNSRFDLMWPSHETKAHQAVEQFAREFCATFDLKIDNDEMHASGSMSKIPLTTKNGYYGGAISYVKDPRRSSSQSDTLYVYTHDRIMSSRTINNSRFSAKLPALIKKLEKTKEGPSEWYELAKYDSQTRSNLNVLKKNTGITPTINVNTHLAVALIRNATGEQTISHNDTITAAQLYKSYLEEVEKSKVKDALYNRFVDGGFYSICAESNSGKYDRYFVAEYEAALDSDGEKIVKRLNNVNTLSSLDELVNLRADLAMAKSYFQKVKPDLSASNSAGIPIVTDQYMDELDMLVAYQKRNQAWLYIPKVAP